MPFSDLEVEFVNGKNWLLVKDFQYQDPKEGLTIVVPAGFLTDFASIPRGLWNIFPPTGSWGPAAVIHDFLYRTAPLPRDVADRIFLHGMEELGVSWINRRIIYRGVRIFGVGAYKG